MIYKVGVFLIIDYLKEEIISSSLNSKQKSSDVAGLNAHGNIKIKSNSELSVYLHDIKGDRRVFFYLVFE